MTNPGSRAFLALLLLVSVAGSGCGEAGGTSGLLASVDTVDGASRFLYPGEGGAVLPWQTDTTALIGEVMSDDDAYQFDRVPGTGIAGDGNGNVFVLDGASSRVLAYDSEGRHRGTFGRAGSGPGKLGAPISLSAGAADTVWVLDPINRRLTGFALAGGDPRVVTVGASGGFTSVSHALATGGFLLQQGLTFRLGGGASFSGGLAIRARAPVAAGTAGPRISLPGLTGDSADNRIPIVRVDGDGAPGDTLWRSTPPTVNPVQASTGRDRVMVMAMPARYVPTLRWAAFADGGIVISETDKYELTVVGPDGRLRFHIARDMAPWPVTETEKEYAREQIRNSQITIAGAPAPDMQQMIQQQIENLTFAETVPRIAGLAIDHQDRIWVGVSIDTPTTVQRVDLYSRDGEFLGSLQGIDIPDAFLGNGLAASLFRDPDTDVQRVAVYRLLEGTPR